MCRENLPSIVHDKGINESININISPIHQRKYEIYRREIIFLA